MSFSATDQEQTFGQFIKTHRIARRWTIRTFARLCGISHVYYCNLETGKQPPPSDPVLLKMAECLEIPAHTLFALAGRLTPAVTSQFWAHPAIPPILSTVGMTLPDAQTFCAHIVATLPQSA